MAQVPPSPSSTGKQTDRGRAREMDGGDNIYYPVSWWAFESFVHELCNSAGCFLGESSLLEHSAGHCI